MGKYRVSKLEPFYIVSIKDCNGVWHCVELNSLQASGLCKDLNNMLKVHDQEKAIYR